MIPDEQPIYVGLYVDNLIYFSPSQQVQQKFEEKFGNHISTTFNGQIDYFLGIKFTHQQHTPTSVTVNMTQTAFIENLLHDQNFDGKGFDEPKTPYKSGYPIDNIPTEEYSPTKQLKLTALYQISTGQTYQQLQIC